MVLYFSVYFQLKNKLAHLYFLFLKQIGKKIFEVFEIEKKNSNSNSIILTSTVKT